MPVNTANYPGVLRRGIEDIQATNQFNKYQERILSEERFTGFLPDEATFEADLEARLDEIYAQLPIGQEAFNADLAARGIFSAGEAPAALYRDVYAPIARAGASAVAGSRLAFQQQTTQAKFEMERFRQMTWATMLDAMIRREQIQAQEDAQGNPFLSAIGTGIGIIGGGAINRALGGGGGGPTPRRQQ